MINEAFISLLLQSPTIAQQTSGRVGSDQIAQNTPTPSITIWVPRERPLNTLDGPLNLDHVVMRVECLADSRTQAESLRDAVRQHIGGFWGVVEGILIKEVSQRDGREQFTYRVSRGTDSYAWVSRQDWNVFYDAPVSAGST